MNCGWLAFRSQFPRKSRSQRRLWMPLQRRSVHAALCHALQCISLEQVAVKPY